MSKIGELISGIRYNLRKPELLFHGKKARQALRESWGRELEIDRDFGLIAAYHELSQDTDRRRVVDDKTWRDLNMDEIFCRLDRTASAVGRQHLYRTLRRFAATGAEVQARNELYGLFREDAGLREEIQLTLGRLKAPNASYIIHLILGQIPAKPRVHQLIYLSSLITVCSSLLLIFTRQFFYIPLLFAVVNIVLHAIYSNRLYQYFPGLSYLNTLLGVAISLTKIENARGLPQIQKLSERIDAIKKMRKAVGWLVIDRARLGDLLDTAVEYLNLFWLFDLVAFIRSLDSLNK